VNLIQINVLGGKEGFIPEVEHRSSAMPLHDIIVLTAIVSVFTTFGVVLAAATWYCSDKRKRPVQSAGHRHYDYPTNASVIIDD
jgi:multisubunit Na+/H+ antiporter MnhC subunit